MQFYWDFQVQATIQRIRDFKERYSSVWTLVLSDIRDNVPAYRVRCRNYQGLHISIFFRQPDCDISGFELRALFNSWEYTVERSALSLPRSLRE